ncbi:hypothetical protein [Clostridium tetani]|nr:hypothetical protein [Clostridium tetani]
MPIEATNIKIYSENTFSSDFYYDELTKLGFTESEMYDLYLKESNKLGNRLSLPDKLSKNINKNFAYPTRSSVLNDSYISYSRSLERFPSNPQTGKTYEITHTVYLTDLANAMGYPGGAAGVASYIASKGTREVAKGIAKVIGLGGVGMAMGAASFLLGRVTNYTGDYGIQWSQTWYYGEDNNMSIGWTPGYASGYKWVRR